MLHPSGEVEYWSIHPLVSIAAEGGVYRRCLEFDWDE